jgi:hypothetical protein
VRKQPGHGRFRIPHPIGGAGGLRSTMACRLMRAFAGTVRLAPVSAAMRSRLGHDIGIGMSGPHESAVCATLFVCMSRSEHDLVGKLWRNVRQRSPVPNHAPRCNIDASEPNVRDVSHTFLSIGNGTWLRDRKFIKGETRKFCRKRRDKGNRLEILHEKSSLAPRLRGRAEGFKTTFPRRLRMSSSG